MAIIFCSVITEELSKEVDSDSPSLSRHLKDGREQAVRKPKARALQAEQEQTLSPGNAPGMIKEYREVQRSRSGVNREDRY